MSTLDFVSFATSLVARHDDNLCNDGPEAQIADAVAALEKFSAHFPLTPADEGHMIDLAGFGEAPVHFLSGEDSYLLLSEVAVALGVPLWEAYEWARNERLSAVDDQRRKDEERGDGLLGWEFMGDYCDLNLDLVVHHAPDYPGCEPDAAGNKWDFSGDFLISHDRLLAFISFSPWGKELMNNMQDLFAHAARRFFDPSAVQVFREDGTPASAEELWHTDLTEEEARAKARRGPAGAFGEDTA